MTEYTDLQTAVLTMLKDDLNTAAGIITDWTGRLLNGRFEDPETGERRLYEMPEDLRPHLEVLSGMRDRGVGPGGRHRQLRGLLPQGRRGG